MQLIIVYKTLKMQLQFYIVEIMAKVIPKKINFGY